MEEMIIKLIGSLGFPIFTALYFMTRLEKHLQRNNELLTALIERVGKDG